ncbi:MAG: RNA polymerase sigma factor [Bacteroidales bacterium]|nr:RNA polymerase sigma factor [Bacteroidales bacterium]
MDKFSHIWIPLSDRFYRVAYYLLESESDAEDAVQELYLKLWAARNSLEDIQNPSAYGILLLKNICIDRIRKRTVRKAEPLDNVPMLEDAGAEDREEIKDTLRHLMQEMEKLPEKQRDVLRMKTIEGLEYEEISRRTGISQVYVRVLITMARKTLRSKLRL